MNMVNVVSDDLKKNWSQFNNNFDKYTLIMNLASIRFLKVVTWFGSRFMKKSHKVQNLI